MEERIESVKLYFNYLRQLDSKSHLNEGKDRNFDKYVCDNAPSYLDDHIANGAPKNWHKMYNESTKNRSRKRLNEGTSNFYSMDYFPLLVFEDIETADDKARDYAFSEMSQEEIDELGEYSFESDHPRFQELVDEYFDKYSDCIILDEYDIDRLKEDIDQFNDSMKRKYYYNDDVEEGTNSVDGEEWDGVYPSVSIRPGYYEAYQLYVNVEPKSDVIQNYKYFLQEQIDEVGKFLNNMKKKYSLTQLGVSYRFSNGETGYHKL